jgi:4-amino-4-deoxy-L-arabinose transferase-like glycosyltransferase
LHTTAAESLERSPDGRRRFLPPVRDGRAGAVGERIRQVLGDPGPVLGLLLVVALILRLAWLNIPVQGLIFDEAYYVNAARVILHLPATTHYADAVPGFDPNTEHPALGKLLIAGSMAILGDNAIAWRLPSVLFGMLALVAVYLIARDTTKSRWLPIAVTAFVAFDNLTFVQGRIGTLDILVLAPMLLGSWLAIRRRWILAGVALGLALLIKITAIYGVGAVLLYWFVTEGWPILRARRRPRLGDVRGPVGFVVITLSIMLGGLTILDARLSQFPSPVDHITRIVTYGANLKAPITVGHCPEIDSKPWQWPFNDCQINYYRTDVTVKTGSEITAKYPKIEFQGALNPLLASTIPLAALFTAWYGWRTRNRLALWALAWAATNYLPYVVLALFTPRIMYLYYALPLVPVAAAGLALLLTRGGLPRPLRWGYMALYLVGFAAYFPFRQIP